MLKRDMKTELGVWRKAKVQPRSLLGDPRAKPGGTPAIKAPQSFATPAEFAPSARTPAKASIEGFRSTKSEVSDAENLPVQPTKVKLQHRKWSSSPRPLKERCQNMPALAHSKETDLGLSSVPRIRAVATTPGTRSPPCARSAAARVESPLGVSESAFERGLLGIYEDTDGFEDSTVEDCLQAFAERQAARCEAPPTSPAECGSLALRAACRAVAADAEVETAMLPSRMLAAALSRITGQVVLAPPEMHKARQDPLGSPCATASSPRRRQDLSALSPLTLGSPESDRSQLL